MGRNDSNCLDINIVNYQNEFNQRNESSGKNSSNSVEENVMERSPDVEAIFEFNATRKNPANDVGAHHQTVQLPCPPAHLVTDTYLTTGIHHYYGVESVAPNGTAKGTITFLSPESYPHCLWIGKKIRMQEGGRIVGYATVTRIYNPLLRLENQE